MEAVKIGIIGLGTVGAGVVNVLAKNAKEIERRAGRKITIKSVAVKDINKARQCGLTGFHLTQDPLELINDPEIDIIVELMGGETLAKDYVLAAIEQNKPVVTANKALIAKYGNEIFAKASERGVMIAFEAAVAGGIPVIKTIREGLAANEIKEIAGIINGTCNYILSSMQETHADFSAALSEAMKKGYAEADPSFDIDGIDVAHKLTILASIAFGIPLQFDKVYIEGIRNIPQNDLIYAEELGYVIKHLGIAKKTEKGIELRVHPTLIPTHQTMAHVNGVMNAVFIKGDCVGPILLYGAGAGANPTASAVVADLVDVVRTLTTDPNNRVPHLAFQEKALEDSAILPISQTRSAYYLRLFAADKSGVLADITKILAIEDISIESILQKEKERQQGFIPIVIITQKVTESQISAAIKAIENLPDITQKVVMLRLETLEE